MADQNILDFRTQAEQLVRIIENKLKNGQRQTAVELTLLKFKVLYEQGILGGVRYEKEGIFPYTPINEDNNFL